MVHNSDSSHASVFVRLIHRIESGQASYEDHKAFASLCGLGLKRWQDYLKAGNKTCHQSSSLDIRMTAKLEE